MEATDEQELKNLERLNLMMASSVREVFEATIVLIGVDALFHRTPSLFSWNPANTLPYSALRALEERCIVHIAELLNDEHKIHPVRAEIRRKSDLFRHRDGLSHPVTVKWRKPDRQEFFEEGRVWRDVRAALVWDMQRSINDVLRAAQRETRNDDVTITRHMAVMVETIMRLSLTEVGTQVVISIPEIPELLERAKRSLLNFVVQYPDGRQP